MATIAIGSEKIQKTKIRKINIATGIMLFIAFVAVFLIPGIAHADEDKNFPLSMAQMILEGVSDTINNTFSDTNGMYSYVSGETMATEYAAATLVFKTLALILCFAIAFSHMFEKIEKGQDTMDSILNVFTELIICFALIANLDKLMDFCTDFMHLIQTTLSGAGVGTLEEVDAGITAEDLLTAVTGEASGGLVWEVQAICALILPYALAVIGSIAATLACYSILVEMAIRKIFAPLAVYDIYQEGLRSPGFRYIKKYLACLLRVVVTMVIASLGGQLTSALMTSGTGSVLDSTKVVIGIIAINFTVIGMIFKSSEYANDIVGV